MSGHRTIYLRAPFNGPSIAGQRAAHETAPLPIDETLISVQRTGGRVLRLIRRWHNGRAFVELRCFNHAAAGWVGAAGLNLSLEEIRELLPTLIAVVEAHAEQTTKGRKR